MTSQQSVAKRLSVSAGLVNTLVRRAEKKRVIGLHKRSARHFDYYLTTKGVAEKNRLLAEHLQASLDIFRRARFEYSAALTEARRAGRNGGLFVGHGDLAEIALIAARDTGFEVTGVIAPSEEEERVHGLPVIRTFDECGRAPALVITDSRNPQKIFDKLRKVCEEEKIVVPPLFRLVR